MILSWADSLIVMSCDERQGEGSALTRWNYLEPKWPLFLKVNPSKQGPFQSKQGSFGFQVFTLSIFKTPFNLRRWRCHSDFQKFMRTQQAISGRGFCSLLCDCKISMKSGLNHQQVIQAVTFLSPIWRSLNLWRGHLTIPKRSPAELPAAFGHFFSDHQSMASLRIWTHQLLA